MLGLRYGFLTTYQATVFLKLQRRDPDWVVECSPVVMYDGKESSAGSDRNMLRGFSKHGLRAVLSSMTYHCWSDGDHELEDVRNVDLVVKTTRMRSKSMSDLHKV